MKYFVAINEKIFMNYICDFSNAKLLSVYK